MTEVDSKNGFTLVELLAVIVVLAIVMLVAVQSVLPQMEKARRQTLALDGQTAIEAANTYFMNLSLSTGRGFPSAEGGKNCVSIDTLVSNGYFSVKGSYDGKVVVTKKGNVYLWSVWLHKDQLMIMDEGNNGTANVQIQAYDATGNEDGVVPYVEATWNAAKECATGEILSNT